MEAYFNWTKTRNCRRFIKRTYTLKYEIDLALVEVFENYGFIEIQKFSTYSASAKDTFKIKIENTLEIAGTLCDYFLQITVKKDESSFIEEIEGTINQWSSKKAMHLTCV